MPLSVTDPSVEHNGGTDAPDSHSVGSSLLERLKAKSPGSWHRFVYLFGPLVYQWCRKHGLQEADACDVRQETFRAVAANIGDFRRDRPGDAFRGWLWKITRSKLADHWRRREKEVQAAGGSPAQKWLATLATSEGSPEEDPPTPETPGSLYQRALELIQNDFQEQTWKAFWRVAVDGATPADAAAELNLSVNAVYLAKSRVLRRLREELGDLFD